jgi:hypothetical protein
MLSAVSMYSCTPVQKVWFVAGKNTVLKVWYRYQSFIYKGRISLGRLHPVIALSSFPRTILRRKGPLTKGLAIWLNLSVSRN